MSICNKQFGMIAADLAAANDLVALGDHLRTALDNPALTKGWRSQLLKLEAFLDDGQPRFSIHAGEGNSKLPFVSFSTAPGSTCPGAGECLEFCYSYRAWRYPAALARQIQNTVLMQTKRGRALILADLDTYAKKAAPTLNYRLYVDGDFQNETQLAFWMDALASRPWLKCYGYSKSWAEFVEYARTGGEFPSNYLLNLSSGSNASPEVAAAVRKLSCVRGEFNAVSLGRAVKSTDHGDRAHQAELRQVYGKKAFTCPGQCGTCTKVEHACGSDRFKGLDIIIAVH